MAFHIGESNIKRDLLSIEDLPEEILEQIISNLSPYDDLIAAKQVSKQWHRLVEGIRRQKILNFQKAVQETSVYWSLFKDNAGATIAERYSHCACYAGKSVYVFGGCTSTSTTFNDLWRFDLASHQWIRPLAMGSYPSPKACASMVVYKDDLVLFGGWNYPSPYPLHRAPRFFNELHSYSLTANRWSHLLPQVSPRACAGHSACVVQDMMIVFGGCHSPGLGSNDTWVYDFIQKNWGRQSTTLPQPLPRYGQSQLAVDESHVLIVGGCGGPNQVFSDIWLLSLTGNMWTWSEVTVISPENSPAQLWCHPACKVGDYAVVLSRSTKAVKIYPDPCSSSKQRENSHLNQEHPSSKAQRPSGSFQNSAKLKAQSKRDSCKGKMSAPSQIEGASSQLAGSSDAFEKDVKQSFAESVLSDSTSSDDTFSKDENEVKSFEMTARNQSVPDSFRQQARKFCGMQAPSCSDSASRLPGIRSGLPSIRPNAMKNRAKQLDVLSRHAERIRQHLVPAAEPSPARSRNFVNFPKPAYLQEGCDQMPKPLKAPMFLHALDLTNVVCQGQAVWVEVKDVYFDGAPEETVFYTICPGRGELLMFGGIQKDLTSMQIGVDIDSHVVKNDLYIISSKSNSIG